MKKHWLYAVAAAALIAGCSNGTAPPPAGPGPVPPGPATLPLVAFVNQIFAATNETGSPIEINTLPIDTTDETAGLYSSLII